MLWWGGRRLVPTEARTSIRESLRIFKVIEAKLASNKKTGALFERLIFTHRGTTSAAQQLLEINNDMRTPSCGDTNSAFASLFFSQEQLSQNAVSNHTNGSDLHQLANNLNIVLWSFREYVYPPAGLRRHTALLLGSIVHSQASALEASLFRGDGEAELPRVVFCNCTWVLYEQNERSDGPISSSGSSGGGGEDSAVRDHQFSIVKVRTARSCNKLLAWLVVILTFCCFRIEILAVLILRPIVLFSNDLVVVFLLLPFSECLSVFHLPSCFLPVSFLYCFLLAF
jgi:hypothetical protein